MSDGMSSVRSYRGHVNSVDAVCALNAKQFLSGSKDTTVKLWNVDSSTAVRTYSLLGDDEWGNPIQYMCALNDKQFVTSASHILKVWNVDDSTAVRKYKYCCVRFGIWALNANQFVVGYSRGVSPRFNLDEKKEHEVFNLKLYDVLAAVDGSVRTYSGHKKKAQCIDSLTFKNQKHFEMDAACLVNGKQFVSGARDGTLKLWNV